MLDFDYDMSGGKNYGDSVKLMAFMNFYSVKKSTVFIISYTDHEINTTNC